MLHVEARRVSRFRSWTLSMADMRTSRFQVMVLAYFTEPPPTRGWFGWTGTGSLWGCRVKANNTRIPQYLQTKIGCRRYQVAFSSDRKGKRDLYLRAADGSGEDEILAQSDENKNFEDWSGDGEYLLFGTD